ncbi:MAG: hypothetical protein KA758_01325 [Acidimicrobiales bacterium]|nr:hypothetical protein [Acidimicrobiales bacterium]
MVTIEELRAVYDELARMHDAHQEWTIIHKNATGQKADWSICEALAGQLDRIAAKIEALGGVL